MNTRAKHGTSDRGPELGTPEDLYDLNRERRQTEDAISTLPNGEAEDWEDVSEQTVPGAIPSDRRRPITLGGVERTELDRQPPSEFPEREAVTLPGKVIREAMGPFTRFVRAVSTGPQALVALAIVGGIVYLARLWLLK